MQITFSSCFYIIKSKFDANQYLQWLSNLVYIANNFNLVIYTDEYTFKFIDTKNKPNIKVVIRPLEQFYLYKYKDYWISNHKNNHLLKDRIEWSVNMLWSEKLWFVNETIQNNYFDTEFHGYCDIGYFRNRGNDMHINQLTQWPNDNKIVSLDKNKIHYARVNNDMNFINYLFGLINTKNNIGLPFNKIPDDQLSIAGGFFLIHREKISWWCETYETKLKLYFENNYLVKDDQIIIIDCIFSNIKHFKLHEEISRYDIWFMFQRLLS